MSLGRWRWYTFRCRRRATAHRGGRSCCRNNRWCFSSASLTQRHSNSLTQPHKPTVRPCLRDTAF
eukprot:3372535-Amphidinium_carterae.1